MRRENFLELAPAAPAVAVAPAAAGTVRGWNRLALQAIRSARPGPLEAARALAILHTSMYNAWAAYDDRARQTAHGAAVRLPRHARSAAGKASAMSHAAWRALGGRFPGLQADFDARMAALGLDTAAPGDLLGPAGIGRAQAAALLDFYRCDADAHVDDRAGGRAGPALEDSCLLAHRFAERGGHDEDRDVLLFFALANALADAAIAGWSGAQEGHGSAGAAAAEVIRRFSGEAPVKAAPAGQELGRQVGARAFEDARRYWEGRL